MVAIIPFRWSRVLFVLLFLITFLTLSRIASTYSSSSPPRRGLGTNASSSAHRRRTKVAAAVAAPPGHHLLQEEQHLRNRNAQILQDLDENDSQQLEISCTDPLHSSSTSSSLLSLSDLSTPGDELSLQQQDFEKELALEIRHQLARHPIDATVLNESPSALERHLARKLRYQKKLMSAHRASLQQQQFESTFSYSSQECVAWRARRQQQQQKERNGYSRKQLEQSYSSSGSSSSDVALTRFQQFHPNRRDLDARSIFAGTLNALAQKRYTDPNGYVVELDPTKVMAGSRRANAYQNDDIHVLVLDMQWDPEVTVVVGNVLDETIRLREEGYRPVMLNVANPEVPGGDYHLDSAVDVEADLFRRTTLHQCLDQEPRRSRFYPLSEFGGVYCPNQAVFRHGMDRENEFMDRFEWISVVSVPTIPKLETREKDGGLGGVQFMEGEDDKLRRNILAAMKVGVSQGHDALILPPHGTDKGQNPSEAIAAIYRSIIGRDFMGGRKRFQTYKKIIMVLDPDQADKIVNETSSYRPTQPPLPPAIETSLPVEDNVDSGSQDEENEAHALSKESGVQAGLLSRRGLSDSSFENEKDKNENENDGEHEDGDEQDKEGSDSRSVLPDTDADTDSNENDGEYEDSDEQDKEDSDSRSVLPDTDDDTDSNENPEIEPEEEEQGQREEEEEEALAANISVLDEEVSESDALIEEQLLKEDAELSDEDLDEDLNEGAALLLESSDGNSEFPEISLQDQDDEGDQLHDPEDVKTTGTSEQSDDMEEEKEERGDDSEPDEEEEEPDVPFVPITETVREVFERMLEQRSLLIVKNRARGILEPEDPSADKNATLAGTDAPVVSALPTSVVSALPTSVVSALPTSVVSALPTSA